MSAAANVVSSGSLGGWGVFAGASGGGSRGHVRAVKTLNVNEERGWRQELSLRLRSLLVLFDKSVVVACANFLLSR